MTGEIILSLRINGEAMRPIRLNREESTLHAAIVSHPYPVERNQGEIRNGKGCLMEWSTLRSRGLWR